MVSVDTVVSLGATSAFTVYFRALGLSANLMNLLNVAEIGVRA